MLRRLEKRILVHLPTKEARLGMLKHHLPPVISSHEKGLLMTSDIDYETIAEVLKVFYKKCIPKSTGFFRELTPLYRFSLTLCCDKIFTMNVSSSNISIGKE